MNWGRGFGFYISLICTTSNFGPATTNQKIVGGLIPISLPIKLRTVSMRDVQQHWRDRPFLFFYRKLGISG